MNHLAACTVRYGAAWPTQAVLTPAAYAAARPTPSWPLSDATGPIPAEADAPGSVRAKVRQALASWGLADATDVISLVASELATNAAHASEPMLLAGQDPVIVMCLLTDWRVARVEVWDQAPGLPVLRDAPEHAESGRGLVLVNALTGGLWGWIQVAALLPAKCVWAECALVDAPDAVSPHDRWSFPQTWQSVS